LHLLFSRWGCEDKIEKIARGESKPRCEIQGFSKTILSLPRSAESGVDNCVIVIATKVKGLGDHQ
jgi:hypothetical protein